MKALILLAFAVTASGQSLHVTGTKRANDVEKTYKTQFNQNIITGDIDGKHYTMEQLAAFGFYHFEVGTDYPVVQITDSVLKVRVLKQGKERTESLNVIGVSE